MTSFTLLKNNNSQKLLAGLLALVLVAGMTSPAFAQEAPEPTIIRNPDAEIIVPNIPVDPLNCEITLNQSINVEIEAFETSEEITKEIQCNNDINQAAIYDPGCELNQLNALGAVFLGTDLSLTETFLNQGDTSPDHCEMMIEMTDVYGQTDTVFQDIWINMNQPIGGTVGSMSTTSLLVAGAQANMGLWSLALVGVVGAAAAITYKVKSKSEQ
jgi:hypothetical protein